MKYLKQNLIYYILILLSLLIVFSATTYKLYSLNKIGVFISLSLSIVVYIILLNRLFAKKNRDNRLKIIHTEQKQKDKPKNIFFKIIPTLYLLNIVILFFILYNVRSAGTLISPWEIIPIYFFPLYFLSILLLIIYSLSSKQKIIYYSLHFFLSFGVALVVYKIGYGFDSFIHQATEDLISKTGSVDPKPFYYLGQYGLMVILHKLTYIPIIWIDKLLVPFLAALFLPQAICNYLKKQYSCDKTSYLLIIASLIIPFSFFVVTTPQNLSYLFLILTILYGLACKNTLELLVVYMLALASLAIHPLAGIPAFLFVLLLHIYHSDIKKLKKYLYLLIFIISSVSLPVIFSFLNKGTNSEAGANTFNFNFLELIIPGKENFILNAVYLYEFNIKYIIILLAMIGIAVAYKNKKECKIHFISLIMSLALLISFLLLNNISFDYLIDYERNDYTNRILTISTIFLIPFILSSLYLFFYKILIHKKAIKIPFVIFIAFLITISLYNSYPRFDRYFNSHGYSTSQADISAVQYIEKNHINKYIVLANQQVSAAALREFGFNRYLYPQNTSKEIYFYPIPTGGNLYNFYLEAVYEKPSKELMQKAMEFANVTESYLILNKYWWAFSKIADEAKLEADSFTEINDGEIIIFKYLK